MRKIVFVVLSLIPSIALAETKKLPVTADVGICAHRREVHLNTGGNSHVRIKGNEHYYLFNFDTKQIRNWKITRATLHLKLARGRLRKVAFCTVPAAWVEGTAVNKPQKGSTCFTHLKYPDIAWTPHVGTMLDATFNSPYMMWKTSDVTVGKSGWLEIPIAPELIRAVAVGLSHGLVMSDEKGQTRENHDVFTREQAAARPYLMVDGATDPRYLIAGPAPVRGPFRAHPCPDAADLASGAIRVFADPFSVVSVQSTEGGAASQTRVTFRKAELVFTGLKPGKEYLVRGRTLDRTADDAKVQASPALTTPKAPSRIPPKTMKRVHKRNGWRVELLPATTKTSPNGKPLGPTQEPLPVPTTARNAWVGLQVVITPSGGKAENVSVSLDSLGFQGRQSEMVPPIKHARLYRVWYVPKGKDHHAEVLVPLKVGEKFSIPWAQNKAPNQANQAIFADVWIPKNAAPGPYEGALAITRNGKPVLEVPIRIRVADVTLADEFHVVGDMNAYGSPAKTMGVRPSDPQALMAMERKYYRLAHAHRMTLNVLPYSQSGRISWRGAPKTVGKGKDRKIVDWSDWDERFGPLLSGKAFTKKHGYIGPGEGMPIHHMYLPFHENWPAKLAEHFKPWPPPKDYKKFLLWTADLPPIEKCLDKDFEAAWLAVSRQFLNHLTRLGWVRTRYQVYVNNKYYFRNPARSSGRGTSLWLLDEPMFADDFLALAHFGQLTRRGVFLAVVKQVLQSLPRPPEAAGREAHERDAEGNIVGGFVLPNPPLPPRKVELPPIDFRIDISRPTHQRNWLDRWVSLNVCADQLYNQRRLIARRKRVFGEEYWNYKMPPSFAASNAEWTVWPVRSYCWGAAGTLPWQTIGSDGDLYKADETALMYPGRKFGLDEPVPSLRMKAWRDGIQTAELLRMLKTKMKWNDLQLRAFVGQVCKLDGWKDGMDPKEDDPIVTFRGMTPEKLAQLKRATIVMLSGKN